MELLEERLKALPQKPGVYLFKDERGLVLYVGKAASLRPRVRSYFGQPSGLPPKHQRMMRRVADFDFLVTDSEPEAVILECTLIKKYRPRYNVRLKDDKSYPYLKISLAEDFPRVYITRRVEKDGSRYFGPFASAGSVRITMELIKKLFPYRSCTRTITGHDPRPCLDYYIHHCLGPCIGAATKEEYAEVIRQVILFLEGKQEQVARQLRARMEEAAQNLEFERAAVLRDQLQAVERVTERQKMVSPALGDQDVIALAQSRDQASVQLFFIRSGKLIEADHFILEGTQDEAPPHILTSFVLQFYDAVPYIPPHLLLQHPLEDMPLVAEWLKNKKGERVSLAVPQRGEKKKLVDMAAENANLALEQLRVKDQAENIASALGELEAHFQLPHPPKRIECYDISDIGGSAAVGSMVVFENGRPRSAHYRRFKIKTVAGVDDYAMIQEVLRRRFKRVGLKTGPGEDSWAIVPDLVLIDGGKGHLSAALEAMKEAGADSIPAASLAKEREEVFLPGRPESLLLPRNSPALYLLQRLRDEAHRFALSYHQKVRKAAAMASVLDSVPGIGPKRKRALLKRFGSVRGIKEASLDDLAAVIGMTRALAEKVKEYL